MQQILLNDIVEKWAQAVLQDCDINAFCQEKYNKLPIVQIGWDAVAAPTDEDCPYVAFHMAHKNEANQPGTYQISVLWAIKNDNIDKSTDRLWRYDGVAECDMFGDLIIKCVDGVNPSYPLTDVDYDIENENFYPGWPGHAVLTLEIPIRMGTSIKY